MRKILVIVIVIISLTYIITSQYMSEKYYENINPFSEGMAEVKRSGKWGYIDEEGNEIITPQFSYAWGFENGIARIMDKNGMRGLITKKGEYFIRSRYKDIEYYSDNFIAVLKESENGYKWGVISSNERQQIPYIYNRIKWLTNDHVIGITDIGIDIINMNTYSILNTQYESMKGRKEKLVAVERDGKWGFSDKKGQLVIEIIYDDVENFSEGLAVVKKGDMWGVIDTQGNEVVSLQYEEIKSYNEGIAVVRRNGKWGAIDCYGKK